MAGNYLAFDSIYLITMDKEVSIEWVLDIFPKWEKAQGKQGSPESLSHRCKNHDGCVARSIAHNTALHKVAHM